MSQAPKDEVDLFDIPISVIIVATDYATRWAETKALPNAKAGSVAKFMLQNTYNNETRGSSRHFE